MGGNEPKPYTICASAPSFESFKRSPKLTYTSAILLSDPLSVSVFQVHDFIMTIAR